jgi:phage shock protein C
VSASEQSSEFSAPVYEIVNFIGHRNNGPRYRSEAVVDKKLARVEEGRMIAGVCTGLGAYFDVDPTVIRVIFIVLSILSFAFGAFLLYGVLWAIMPMEA